MTDSRCVYEDAMVKEVVSKYMESNQSVCSIAREYDIPMDTVRDWIYREENRLMSSSDPDVAYPAIINKFLKSKQSASRWCKFANIDPITFRCAVVHQLKAGKVIPGYSLMMPEHVVDMLRREHYDR